jgi:leader peptidase (prepilin peptidase)/N-methyltransferase
MDLLARLRVDVELLAFLTGLLGLMVGSFLNVVIHRLPRVIERAWRLECAELTASDDGPSAPSSGAAVSEPAYNLVTPRSQCPHCATQLRARDNIPVVSWILLRGRCAHCRAPISVRYPAVELLTALVSATVAAKCGLGWEMVCGLVISWYLIAMSAIDIDTQLLPDSLTLPLMWGGLLAATVLGRGSMPFPTDPTSAVLGAACGYLSLWSVYQLFKLVTGKEGMGYGDFKLLAALGAWLGWQLLLPTLLLAAASGAVIGSAVLLLKRQGRDVPIPFGPYLAVAGWLVMLWAPELIEPWWAFAH